MSKIEPKLIRQRYISEAGKQGWMVVCSSCNEYFRVYEWSINGCGKKCPGCGHLYKRCDLE